MQVKRRPQKRDGSSSGPKIKDSMPVTHERKPRGGKKSFGALTTLTFPDQTRRMMVIPDKTSVLPKMVLSVIPS